MQQHRSVNNHTDEQCPHANTKDYHIHNPDQLLVVEHQENASLILLLAKQMPDYLFIVLSDFKSNVVLPNLHLVGFADNPAKYYLNADLVITQAGHSTAMELITLGLPMLVVPDTNQVEQESNAKRLCELGLASMISYKDLNVESLFVEVQYMLNDQSFSNAAKNMSKIARSYLASEEAVRIIRDYSTRVQAY